MVITKKSCLYLLTGIILALSSYSCESDDDGDDETPATGLPTTTATSTTTEVTAVSSLALIPDIGTMFNSTSSGLVAVNGTPPVFSEIKAGTLETYLSPSVDGIISALQAAMGSNDFSAAQTEIDKFRAAQAKCEVMQSTAWQVQELSQSTNSLCYMSNIGRSSDPILTYVSGEEVTQAEFFAQAETDKVRALTISGDPNEGGDQRIIFSIPGSATNASSYRVKLTFCSEGTSTGSDDITVDNSTGTFTYVSTQKGSYQGSTHNWQAVITAKLLDTDGTVSFDTATARSMVAKSAGSHQGGSYAFETELSILGGVLNSKVLENFTHEWQGQTFSGSSKNAISVAYAGTKFSDIRIAEGAGKRVGQHDTDTYTQQIGFEHNEAVTPSYETVSASTYIDTIAAIDFTTDTLLSKTAPEAPDTSSAADADCALTTDSEYSLDMMGNAAMAAIAESCESGFDGNDRTCDALRNQEDAIWNTINSNNDLN